MTSLKERGGDDVEESAHGNAVDRGSAPLQTHIVIGYDPAVVQPTSKLIVVFHRI
jgi:hypothetical protein